MYNPYNAQFAGMQPQMFGMQVCVCGRMCVVVCACVCVFASVWVFLVCASARRVWFFVCGVRRTRRGKAESGGD